MLCDLVTRGGDARMMLMSSSALDEHGQPGVELVVVAFSGFEMMVCANTMLQLLQDFPGRRFEERLGKSDESVRALHEAVLHAERGTGEVPEGIWLRRLTRKEQRGAHVAPPGENAFLLEMSRSEFQTLAELVRDGVSWLDWEYSLTVGASKEEGVEIAATMSQIVKSLSETR